MNPSRWAAATPTHPLHAGGAAVNAEVRLWHLADIDTMAGSMSAFGGKADISDPRSKVR